MDKYLNEKISVGELLERYKDRKAVAVIDDEQKSVFYTRMNDLEATDDKMTIEQVKKLTSIRQMLTLTSAVIVVSKKWKK